MFKVGDWVEWKSQSQGYAKVKRGVVASVVAPGTRPHRDFWQLYRGCECGMARNHESYVVRVRTVPYWPRVSQLRASQSVDDSASANRPMPQLADVESFANEWAETHGASLGGIYLDFALDYARFVLRQQWHRRLRAMKAQG